METILVADDEASIRELARIYLEKEGFKVITAGNGAQALERIRQEAPDLLVLDLMMPVMDGWELCRRVQADYDIPILMLTARDDDIDKIVGLEMGADDYLTKPFNPREMVARVRAILRRAGKTRTAVESAEPIAIADLLIRPERREVTIKGRPIELRAKEFDLLVALAGSPNIVFSREKLLSLVWGYDYYGRTRTVDVHIANLREKIEGSSAIIETVWGVGYKLVALD